MQRVIITAETICIESGNVYLTGFQYQPRAEYLERVSPGLGKFGEYRILKPIEFIKDEIIGYAGELKDGMEELVKKESGKENGNSVPEEVPEEVPGLNIPVDTEDINGDEEEETENGEIDCSSLTKREIIVTLKGMGVDFDPGDKKSVLLELLEGA